MNTRLDRQSAVGRHASAVAAACTALQDALQHDTHREVIPSIVPSHNGLAWVWPPDTPVELDLTRAGGQAGAKNKAVRREK